MSRLDTDMIPTPASQGTEAIHAGGIAVNAQNLDSTEAIRRALPKARQAAVAVKSRSESTNRQTGRFTGLPIAIYQNWLYEMNREWHFTDGTLCVLWCVEFPDARSDYAEKRHYIASTRRDYNNGRHQGPAPAVRCVEYDIFGTPVAGSGGGERAARPPAEPPPPNALQSAPQAPVTPPTPVVSPVGSLPGPSASGPLDLQSDPSATAARIAALDDYMERHVLGSRGFCCSHFSACRVSHNGAFFEGQLHHVGAHYDLTVDGRALRIVVVGQEYGNGPACVTRGVRTHDVVTLTGYGKRFRSDGVHDARNPHMKGTTSLLRLLVGRSPGSDYEGELLHLNGQPAHLFEAFALTNFLLCSAIPAGEGEVGSKRGKSTPTMQRNCGGHFREVMRILEPTVIVAQGKGVRNWMTRVIEQARSIGPNLESVRIAGRECLLASFTHPSVPSADNWGTDDRRPYLLKVIAPAVAQVRHELRIDA